MAVDAVDAETTIVGVSDARCRGGSGTVVAVDAESVVVAATFATVTFIDSALIMAYGSLGIVVSSRGTEVGTGGI